MSTQTKTMSEELLNQSIKANFERKYYSAYPENPKAYAEDANSIGLTAFQSKMNKNFSSLYSENSIGWTGNEVSPYTQTEIGIKYPDFTIETLIENAKNANNNWKLIDAKTRSLILIETLDAVKERFFELAYATMHTTGQSFMMSFQASGPHANDRALEVIAAGYSELTKYVSEVDWVKNMGKFDLTIHKNFKPVPKGISLVIGCSTFPTWNTVPGLYASLVTGNPVIVKPHPKAILPIALVISEIQKILIKNNINPCLVQLAADTIENPKTKLLAEHPNVKLIDYTGGNAFGDYIETLKNKTTFTEKAGINSVLIESVSDLTAVVNNIAFSVSLYSGQMCTAPQNIYVSKDGISSPNGTISFDDFTLQLSDAISGLVNNPKAGPFTLGAIQNNTTIERVDEISNMDYKVKLKGQKITNPEFENARTCSPTLLIVNSDEKGKYLKELFGPIVIVIKTENFEQSLDLVKNSAQEKGAITCLAYTTDLEKQQKIENELNDVFTPVSFNFIGAAFVNQHAAFSDFHVSSGNPSGNATFTNSEYLCKRFIWVGNRYL